MKRVVIMFLASIVGLNAATAQGLPPVPEKNKCYQLCTTEDEYKDEKVKVMTKPAYKKVEIIPAEYKQVTEEVIIKPASKKYVYVPATYRTVRDTIRIKDGYNKLSQTEAEFSNDFEIVRVKDEISRYATTGQAAPDCEDGKDCQVICTQTIPAEYKSVPIEVKVKDQGVTKDPIEGKYTYFTREEEVTPARYQEIEIPAVKKTFTKTVLVKDETIKEIEIPAEYTYVTKKVLVKRGGVQEWREIECSSVKQGQILPINYVFGSAQLTPSSKKVIDEHLYNKLKTEPGISIEIASHTDAIGGSSANQALSERRAQAVVDYLVSKGIKKSRLQAKGYGETKLLNRCSNGVNCTAEEHAVNRRTEFTVL